LVAECDNIRRLLNEDEFSQDVKALAQDVLNGWQGGDVLYAVKKARVAIVGPAGICMKVRAQSQLQDEDGGKPIHILDVMYPFGVPPMQDVKSLRAAVLGAIAAAEGQQP
jgi:hypothetical protein